MHVMDVIADILKREGISTLFCFPTTPIIEAAAAVGIRPVICRQERVGVHMADGFARVSNGRPPGVFAMQYGPGAENAFRRRRDRFFGLEPGSLPAAWAIRARRRNCSRCSNRRAPMPRSPNRSRRCNLPHEIANVMRRAFPRPKTGGPAQSWLRSRLTLSGSRLTSIRRSIGRYAPAARPATRKTSTRRQRCCSTPPAR